MVSLDWMKMGALFLIARKLVIGGLGLTVSIGLKYI
jgi:hypothetical protein